MNAMQQALARARNTRAAILAGAAAAQSAPAAPTDPGPAPEAPDPWDALPVREVDAGALAEQRIVTPAGGLDAAPFDVMRTKLAKMAADKGWRRVAVTSPTPGCGKSTVSLNLAFALARQAGARIVLCELDFRRPSLAATLGLRDAHRLSRVLRGHAAFADNAVRLGEGLAVATTAGPARAPADLFHAEAMAEALARIEADYRPDLMLFDLPPMRVGDDVLAFAPHVDATLLVAAAEATSVAQVDACERELAERCEVAGVILNKCPYQGEAYGYGGDGYY